MSKSQKESVILFKANVAILYSDYLNLPIILAEDTVVIKYTGHFCACLQFDLEDIYFNPVPIFICSFTEAEKS